MLLDTDRDKNIDLIGEKVSIFCRTHIAVGHRIQGGSPGPLQLKYALTHAILVFIRLTIFIKGIPGRPSGPSREGPGVGHKISVGR